MHARSSLLLLILLVARPSTALQPRLSRRALATAADHVVAVEVRSREALWIAGGVDIATRVELAVLARARGALAASARLELAGGRIGVDQVWVEDVPWLEPARRYGLFLVEDGAGRLAILGGLQGAVRLRDDDGTGPGETWSGFVQSLQHDRCPPLSVDEQPPRLVWYALNGHDWSYQADPVEEPFSINLSSFGLDSQALMARFDDARAVWNLESGAQLWLRSGGDTQVLQFGELDDDHNVLMGEDYHFGSTLSVARYRSSGERMLDCDVRFYRSNLYGDIDWSVAPAGAGAGENDLQHTMTHELGHCLGLSHSDVEGAMMYPTVGTGTGDERRHLQADDIAGIQALYGVRTRWPDAGAALDAGLDGGAAVDAGGGDRGAIDADTGASPADAAAIDVAATDVLMADGATADAWPGDRAHLDRGEDTVAAAGCGCRSARRPGASAWWLLPGALALGLRRSATSRRASAR